MKNAKKIATILTKFPSKVSVENQDWNVYQIKDIEFSG